MSRKKAHHFVPQFYLRHFANPRRQIFTYDKLERISFSTNIKNIAQEQYFYDLHENSIKDNVNSQMVEDTFAGLDTVFDQTINSVLNTIQDQKRITQHQKEELAVLATFFYLRTPSMRQHSLESFDTFTKVSFE